MPIITIDGNIGSGKTTILETLQKKFNQMISLEPVSEWEPYLNDIYKNNVGYFNFQLKVFLDRAFIQSKSNQIIFMERSPKFTRATFVEIYKDKFSTQEYNIIQHLYDNVDHQYNKTIVEPSIYIYIQTDPDICYKRIQERNRESESTISKDLIDKLHIKHEESYDKIFKQGLSTYLINSNNLTPDEIAENIMNHIQGI